MGIGTFFSYFPLILHVISILLHTLGIYLLSSLSESEKNNQTIILIHLSSAEIMMSIFDFGYNLMSKFNVRPNISDYFYIVQCTCFVIPSFLILTILALDRFFEVYLNIRYSIYFSKKIVFRSLLACWFLGIILGVTMTMVQYNNNVNSLKYVFFVLFPLFEAIFFTTAISVYTYIYIKFRQATCQQQTSNSENNQVFKKRKFFVPTLIIWSFFFFAIIPDQLHLFLFHVYSIGSDLLLNIILTLYVTGFICDALIYIALQSNVRKLLLRKLQLRRRSPSIAPGTSLEKTDN